MRDEKRSAPENIAGAIFDLDGTLMDTMSHWGTLGASYLRDNGIEPEPELAEIIGTLSLRGCAEFFQKRYYLKQTADEIIAEIVARLRRFYEEEALMKPLALEVLKLLKGFGVKIALATATPSALACAGLARNGALDYFDAVFSCRDPEINSNKSNPKIFEFALKSIGTAKEETIVVEDALYAIETTTKAGFYTVAVEDDSERRRKEAIVKTSDFYARDHAEFISWIREQFSDRVDRG